MGLNVTLSKRAERVEICGNCVGGSHGSKDLYLKGFDVVNVELLRRRVVELGSSVRFYVQIYFSLNEVLSL